MTQDDVLNYVKSRLGFPYVPLEYTDSQILQLIYLKSIPLFSKYIPNKNVIAIDFSNPAIQTNMNTIFTIIDPNGLKIIDVVELVPQAANLLIAGHPIIGLISGNPSNMDLVANYLLQINNARTTLQFSEFDQTFQFIPPNLIRVLPPPSDIQACIYETQHNPNFSTIPNEFEHVFFDLCFADTAMNLAEIRSYYTNINTPFGEIQLNSGDLYSKAETIRNGIIEQLSFANPSIILDIY